MDKRTRLKVGGKNANDRSSRLFHSLKHDLHFLAVLAVVGIFTRPTFIAFALPIGYQTLQLSCQVAGSPIQAIGLLLPPFYTATLTASVFIAADTYYFRGDFSKLVITPYNFVKYNLSTKNLADHGLHPSWLHVGVNLPMLLGPLFVWFTWCSIYQYVKPSSRRLQKVHFETDILRPSTLSSYLVAIRANCCYSSDSDHYFVVVGFVRSTPPRTQVSDAAGSPDHCVGNHHKIASTRETLLGESFLSADRVVVTY